MIVYIYAVIYARFCEHLLLFLCTFSSVFCRRLFVFTSESVCVSLTFVYASFSCAFVSLMFVYLRPCLRAFRKRVVRVIEDIRDLHASLESK